ncbi:MAG: hypothetical protein JWL91_1782 [Sphingomonas bacterium]|nr:hypothetical protein [Sphingomonas bacterium]MDB5689906.1 hypothetical protein [Sphingomonas bacterium]
MRGINLARTVTLSGAVIAAAAPSPAAKSIVPYIEVQQAALVDLTGDGDVLTYTALAAGVDASINTRRAQGTLSYRYERRIPWNNDTPDQSIHTGLARGSLQLVPDMLTLDAGAIATRARSDIRGSAPVFFVGNTDNITQVYGGYIGPTLNTRVGPVEVGANYRFGYARAESNESFALAPGQQRLDTFHDATSHSINASVGMPSGRFPFGWTVTGGYTREDAGQLDQRFAAKYVRGELVVPVSRTLALTAGLGYEDLESSERAPLRDASGFPVVNSRGRYVTDTSSPRLLSYDQDGLIYDAGVIWRPNRRTTLIARVGHRYGGTTVVGSLDWRMTRNSGLQVNVYDGIESFGRSLTRGLNSIPTGFELQRNPLVDNLNGCIFGTTPGTGGCLDNAFQSLTTANFRARGVNALYTLAYGKWTFGAGGSYTNRKYLAPVQGNLFSLNGVRDESWELQANASRILNPRSTVNGALFANWYDSGIAGAGAVSSLGATASYYHTFGRRLTGQASAGVYTFDSTDFDAQAAAQLLFGLRYQF